MTAAEIWWPEPQGGVTVWCRFPDTLALRAGPKPRPALVFTVFDDDAPQFRVLVTYGTSQKVDRLYAGEFNITPQDGAAYRLAGLSFPTKFNLSRTVELPYSTLWFDAPPAAPFGQTPTTRTPTREPDAAGYFSMAGRGIGSERLGTVIDAWCCSY